MVSFISVLFTLFFIAMVVLAFAVPILLFIKLFRRASQQNQNQEEVEPEISGYRVRSEVLNNSESAFFHALVKALPESYFVFPKMRIADILETIGGYGYIHRRNKILPKHIDFVICNEYFKPLLALELDGKSHEAPDRIERDKLVDGIFASTSLKLKRVEVGDDFYTVAVQITETLKT